MSEHLRPGTEHDSIVHERPAKPKPDDAPADGSAPIAAMVYHLQRTAGNMAVGALIRRYEAQRQAHGPSPAGQTQDAPEVGAEGGPVSAELSSRITAHRGGGSTLDDGLRSRMEGAFGTSLGDVRLHSDAESHAFNRSVSARAFTIGSDIFLGEQASASDTGLLAHELTHVVQQRGSSGGGPLTVGPAGDAHEQEADAVSARVSRMTTATPESQAVSQPAEGEIGQRTAVLQRVRVDGANSTETLLWDQNIPGSGTATTGETATTQMQPRDFSAGGGHYDLTRTASGVNVDVRIVFIGTDEKVLPDPDPRRTWATQMCTTLVHTWNGDHGRFELLGRKHDSAAPAGTTPPAPTAAPAPTAPTVPAPGPTVPAPATGGAAPAADPNEVHVPLRFSATPLFDPSANAAFPRIHVHGSTEQATGNLTGGTAITANQWFMSKQDTVYPASAESIYAHEYGHLLGIPDEYSQNNPQMHALFHKISPLHETAMNDMLDRSAADMLVLMALQPKLLATVNGVAVQIGNAIRAQHQPIDQALAAAIRQSWRQATTVNSLANAIRPPLLATGQNQAAAAVPTSAHFEAFENLSNITLAHEAVAGEIDAAHIQAIVQAAFVGATNPKNKAAIHYPGGPGGTDTSLTVSMNTSTGAQTNASTGPLATAAQAAATATTTPAPVPVVAGHHVPHVEPSNTIIGALQAMPGTWRGAANLMSEQTGDMATRIQTAVAAMAFDVSGINDHVGALYRVLYDTVQAVSHTVAAQAVRAFLAAQINPIVTHQVEAIVALVENEVQGSATVVGPAPDPQVAAAAHQMAAQVQTLLNRPAAGSPAGTGTGAAATQTAQDVSYTVESQMGNNVASNAVRPDQMEGIISQVNSHVPDLRHADEDNFALRNL